MAAAGEDRPRGSLDAPPGESGREAEAPERGQADGSAVLRRLRELPGGPQVLELAAGREDVELVGGAVRDLLLAGIPREIDLALDGAAASFPHAASLFARDLAPLLPCGPAGEQPQVSVHERFGTAAVRWGGGRVDLAARRSERYARPGALPEAAPGTAEQDLDRRDFTVNAIAVGLGGRRRGTVRAAAGAIADLDARLLRVLHDGSFEDDPTRLLRLGRYAARLGFTVEPHTAALAAQALAGGALRQVSDARIGAELRLALREPDLLATLRALSALGVLEALDPPLMLEAELLEQALRLLPGDGRADLLALASLLLAVADEAQREPCDPRDRLLDTLARWEHPATARRPVIEAAMYARLLAEEMAVADCPSELWDLLSGVAVEAVALAGALAAHDGEAGALAAAESWIEALRHTRLQITGADLLRAGVPAGPEIGERLGQALRQRLDGTIEEGREAELRAALEP